LWSFNPDRGVRRRAERIISAAFLKDPTDPQWQDTPEYRECMAWLKKYNTSGNVADSAAQTMVAVFKIAPSI
jgi:branched-chain amino acid transport system substrate-binding protein